MNAVHTVRRADTPEQHDLVGQVYEAVLNPALWPHLLEQMGDYLNTFSVQIDDKTAVLDVHAHDALESHFQRAVKIQQKVSRLEGIAQAFSDILNRLPIGVILLRRDASIVASNRLADQVMDQTNTLSIKNGKLLTRSATYTTQLHNMIRDSFCSAQKTLATMNLGREENETSLWVTASTSIHASLHSDESLAAVFVHSAKIQRKIPLAAFTAKHQLSQAEDRLAKTMLNGCHTLNDAASHLGLSKHTVRAQMKSIFSKTGTSSQTELLKKILSAPSALMSEPAEITVRTHGIEQHVDGRKDARSLRLHDGRKLEWKEFGAPDDLPVIVCHSLTGAHPDYTIAFKMGIRLIVPERPGAHGSDPLPGRTYMDWPDDLRQLINALGIERFSLLGFSSGTPYVLACMDTMPERIESIALISCMAPMRSEDDLAGMLPLNNTAMRLAHQSPELFDRFMTVFLKDLGQDATQYFDTVADHQPGTDIAVLNQQETMDHFLHAFQDASKENFKQLCDEIMLCASDWPVDLSHYTGHVSIWHGFEDPLVPILMGQRIAKKLLNPKRHFLEEEGNYLTYSHWKEILTELVHHQEAR